ncbi:cache domain-containing protein [Paenibacillus sp. CC-CFT747]|nr:cache domain-containing protein [Paenibacillus sp. CC-CFT747]
MNRLLLFQPKGKMFFYKLMVGLFLVAVIPTAVTVYVLHHQFIKSMMDEIGNSNIKLLEQASLNGNMMVNEMTYTASALLNDPSVSYFMQADYTSDAKQFNDLMDKLGTMRSGSRYLTSIYVMFDRFSYAIGTQATNNSFLLPIQQITALDETMLYSDYTRFYFRPVEGDRELYMVRPIQNSSYQTVGAIVITVSAARFRGFSNRSKRPNGIRSPFSTKTAKRFGAKGMSAAGKSFIKRQPPPFRGTIAR